MSIPYVPEGTSKRFRVPRTLAADFDAFLNRDIPNTNMDFEVLRNWYDKFKEDYKPSYVRGELYPDSTKSRYENTDNNMNIRCSVSSGIQKGDMLIEPNGNVYVLDWAVQLQSNNAPSRALRCNLNLEIYEYKDVEVDSEGFLIDEEGYVISGETYPEDNPNESNKKVIVEAIPANAYRYDGRPEFVAVSGTPGAVAGVLTLLTVQFNNQTKNIKIGQYFDWGGNTYEIVDVNAVGLNLDQTFGTLKLQAKRAAGGLHGYE
jgi:hypothetical protein